MQRWDRAISYKIEDIHRPEYVEEFAQIVAAHAGVGSIDVARAIARKSHKLDPAYTVSEYLEAANHFYDLELSDQLRD